MSATAFLLPVLVTCGGGGGGVAVKGARNNPVFWVANSVHPDFERAFAPGSAGQHLIHNPVLNTDIAMLVVPSPRPVSDT